MNALVDRHIKRGEFTFCSRCGYICKRTSRNFMCTGCMTSLFGLKETNETRLSVRFERRHSLLNEQHRKCLAQMRFSVNV